MRRPLLLGVLAILMFLAFFVPDASEAQRRRQQLDLNGWQVPREFQALPWSPGRMFYSIGWAEDVMHEIPGMPGFGRSGSARLFAAAHLLVPLRATAYRGLKAFALDQEGVTDEIAEEWARTAAETIEVTAQWVNNEDAGRCQPPPNNPRWADAQPIQFMMVNYSFDAFLASVYSALEDHDLPGLRRIRFNQVTRCLRDVHEEVGEQWGRRWVWELQTLSGIPATLPGTEVRDPAERPFQARSSAHGELRVGHPDFMIEERAYVVDAEPECRAALEVQYRAVLPEALVQARVPALTSSALDRLIAELVEALEDDLVLDWAMRPDYDFDIDENNLELSVDGAMAVLLECPFEAFVAESFRCLGEEYLGAEGEPGAVDDDAWREALLAVRAVEDDGD